MNVRQMQKQKTPRVVWEESIPVCACGQGLQREAGSKGGHRLEPRFSNLRVRESLAPPHPGLLILNPHFQQVPRTRWPCWSGPDFKTPLG